MIVPAAPLPSVANLINALSANESTGEIWSPVNHEYTWGFYRRGSVALGAGVAAAAGTKPSKDITVWLPGYFCNEALDPVRQLSIRLKFYSIKTDLTPDFERLEQTANAEAGLQIFVVVHYFGFPNATSKASEFCKQLGMILFEDAAHMLSLGSETGKGELIIFSPRKVLALPSGGLLLARKNFVASLQSAGVENDWSESLSWVARRLTQKILLQLHMPWHRFKSSDETTLAVDGRNGTVSARPAANRYSLKLLRVIESDFQATIARRRANYTRLLQLIKAFDAVKPLFADLPNDVCPYAFPLLVKQGSQKVVRKLKESGVMASRWPDLPPEVTNDSADHEIAIDTYQRLMLLPIHQSLNAEDMDTVGSTLQRAIEYSK